MTGTKEGGESTSRDRRRQKRKAKMLEKFKQVSENCHDLYLPNTHIQRLDYTPSPLEFYRDFVARNIPCVFTNSINHWPAHQKWTTDYLCETMDDKKVSVAVTSTGMADCVHNGVFVLPEERKMTMRDFFEKLDSKDDGGSVYYIQKQNSNLTEELSPLLKDVDRHIPWVTEALGVGRPDAVNMWVGGSRSITCLHKDHYENITTRSDSNVSRMDDGWSGTQTCHPCPG